MRVAVVGAGLAGLVLARQLCDRARVSVFEKNAIVGGRFATRRHPPFEFDHGAQFFTARSEQMRRFIAPWLESGHLVEWRPRITTLCGSRAAYDRIWFEPHYVAVPYMRRWCELLAGEVDVRLGVEVTRLEKDGGTWRLVTAQGDAHGPYDWVALATTAPTASRLAPPGFDALEKIRGVRMSGCYSLMLGFDEPLPVTWDCAVVRESPVGWIAVNSRKPGRGDAFSVVVQSTNTFAVEHEGTDAHEARIVLQEKFEELTGIDSGRAAFSDCRYWRFAKAVSAADRESFVDLDHRVAVCGDWCGGDRVEAAFLSAVSCAESVGRSGG